MVHESSSSASPADEPATSPRRGPAHDSSSFVIRFWEEPREGGGEPILRGYIKHLKTGREQYFSDLSEVPALLGDGLDPESSPPL